MLTKSEQNVIQSTRALHLFCKKMTVVIFDKFSFFADDFSTLFGKLLQKKYG